MNVIMFIISMAIACILLLIKNELVSLRNEIEVMKTVLIIKYIEPKKTNGPN